VFPNVFPLIFAESLLNISNAIWAESYLAFLGLTAGGFMSWGMMIEDAWESLAVTKGMWWYVIPPGVCIVLLVLAFSLVGYALEEILNPKLRKI
jgi:peptide/nickel transport system permease protein